LPVCTSVAVKRPLVLTVIEPLLVFTSSKLTSVSLVRLIKPLELNSKIAVLLSIAFEPLPILSAVRFSVATVMVLLPTSVILPEVIKSSWPFNVATESMLMTSPIEIPSL